MTWRAAIVMSVVACYAPRPQPGSPCGLGQACPAGLACSPATDTCELVAGTADDANGHGDILIDGCIPGPEYCGDGIDDDCNGTDPSCPTNDRATEAIDVTAGGTFTGDLGFAHEDIASGGCGSGGRDLFYRVRITDQAKVYYFDTFGSSFDTVLRVYAGKTCPTAIPTERACSDDACNGGSSQLAVLLAPGDHCIVVAQAQASETDGDVTLHVTNTGRGGMPLTNPFVAGTTFVTGNTCTSTTTTRSPCQNNGGPAAGIKNHEYFFPICPGTTLIDAKDCMLTWDDLLYVRGTNGQEAHCNDDSNSANCQPNTGPSELINRPVTGPGVAWLGITGFEVADCNAYNLSIHLH